MPETLISEPSTALHGKRIVVTRAREQADSFVEGLRTLGAIPVEFPVLRFADPLDYAPLDQAIARLGGFDWVIFTSVNGVDFFWRRLARAGLDAGAFRGRKVCAIGPATAQALTARGVEPELVPSKFVAEAILDELGAVAGQKFLLPRADLARQLMVEVLRERGATVEQITAYRTILADDSDHEGLSAREMVQRLEAGEIEVVTFASSSTVRNFATRLASATAKPLSQLLARTLVACIGPITAGTAREMGLSVGLEAPEFTMDGLTDALAAHFNH